MSLIVTIDRNLLLFTGFDFYLLLLIVTRMHCNSLVFIVVDCYMSLSLGGPAKRKTLGGRLVLFSWQGCPRWPGIIVPPEMKALDTGNHKENIRYIGLLAALDCPGIMKGRRDECETILMV